MLQKPDVDFLKQVSLFAALSDQVMVKFCDHARRSEIRAGDVLFEEGKPAKEVVIVVAGSLEVTKRARNGQVVRIATLGPRDVVGEMSLVDIQPRSAGVKALEDSTVVIFSHADIAGIYRDDPQSYTLLVLNIAREISLRLRRMDTMLANITVEIGEVAELAYPR